MRVKSKPVIFVAFGSAIAFKQQGALRRLVLNCAAGIGKKLIGRWQQCRQVYTLSVDIKQQLDLHFLYCPGFFLVPLALALLAVDSRCRGDVVVDPDPDETDDVFLTFLWVGAIGSLRLASVA